MSESNLTDNALQAQEAPISEDVTKKQARALNCYLDDLLWLSEQFRLPHRNDEELKKASMIMAETFASRLKASDDKKVKRQVIMLSNQKSREFASLMMLLRVADTAVKRSVAILEHRRLLAELSSIHDHLLDADAAGQLLRSLRGNQFKEESEYIGKMLLRATSLSEQVTGVIDHEETEFQLWLKEYSSDARHSMDTALDYVNLHATLLATVREVYGYCGSYWDSRKEFFDAVAHFLAENDYVRRNQALYVFAGERLAEQSKEG